MARQTHSMNAGSFAASALWMAAWFGLIGLVVRYGKIALDMSDAPSLHQIGLMAVLGGVLGAVQRAAQSVGKRMRMAASLKR